MKVCTNCHQSKPMTEFYKAKSTKDGAQSWCKTCVKAKAKSGFKDWKLRKYYGITADQFKDLHDKQNGVCAICNRPNVTDKQALSVDHCHKTLKVRGLLCANCNRGLGLFQDNAELMERAAAYIKEPPVDDLFFSEPRPVKRDPDQLSFPFVLSKQNQGRVCKEDDRKDEPHQQH